MPVMLTFSRFITKPSTARKAPSHQPSGIGTQAADGHEGHRQDHAEGELDEEHLAFIAKVENAAEGVIAVNGLEAHEPVDAEGHHHAAGDGLQQVHFQVAVEGPPTEIGFENHHANARADGRDVEMQRQHR